MTIDEKLAHMGFPSAPELAAPLQIPVIKGHELKHGHALVGNGMHMPNIAMVIFSILACVELRECDVMEKLTRPHEIPMNLIHEFNRLSKPFKKTKREYMAYILGRNDNSSAEPSGERLRATHLYVPQQDSTGTEVWQTGEDAVELLATQEKQALSPSDGYICTRISKLFSVLWTSTCNVTCKECNRCLSL